MTVLALRINAKRLVISCVVLAEDAPGGCGFMQRSDEDHNRLLAG
jgi:hypothetical protein